MDNWSENREKVSGVPKAVKLQKIGQINAVLRMLANDEDLQDDLKQKDVITAIKHWTNQKRLSHEEALKLQDNRRVLYVLQKFQVLQQVCKEGGIAVPLDHLMTGQKELSNEFIVKMFGSEFDLSSRSNSTSVKSSVVSTKEKRTDSVGVSKKEKKEEVTKITKEDSLQPGPAEKVVETATEEITPTDAPVTGIDIAAAPELTEKQKKMLWERKIVRRMQEGTIVLVIVMCIVLKWLYDK